MCSSSPTSTGRGLPIRRSFAPPVSGPSSSSRNTASTTSKLEKWGPFGRGWAYTSYSGYIDEPQYQPLIGYPLAWTPGTDGPLTAEAVLAPIRTEADLDQYKGKLRGKIVLRDFPQILSLPTEPAGRRLSDAQLADLSLFPIPAPPGRGGRAGQPPFNPQQARRLRERLNRFWKDEGVPLVVRASSGGDGGTVFGLGGGPRVQGQRPHHRARRGAL